MASTSTTPLSSQPRGTFLAGTSLTFLKRAFKSMLYPPAARLAKLGVTANQVTIISLVGSIAVSALLCVASSYTVVFAILPIWLLVRMVCATIDGTLATEFGQKSRLGGILNEMGDIVSDAALFWPLAFVKPLSPTIILLFIVMIVSTEAVGILSNTVGRGRRLEGPLGKADRTIVLAVVGVVVAIFGYLPAATTVAFPALAAGLGLTIWNRLCFAFIHAPRTSRYE